MIRRLLLLIPLLTAAPSMAAEVSRLPGTVTVDSAKPLSALADSLDQAVAASGMAVVARASASQGAAARGVKIPGNAVIMVFRNDFAVRMLAASVPAGIEAPLRFYLTENADGGTTLTYRKPTAVFAPYGSTDLDRMAAELDPVFARIATAAAK